MTLEEAIKHLLEMLSDTDHEWSCEECREEHEQLLKWLVELKGLRSTVNLLKFNIHALNEILKDTNNEKMDNH